MRINNYIFSISKLLFLPLVMFGMEAQGRALFLNDLVVKETLPSTYGVSIDYFSLEQKYDVASLEFSLPISLDTSQIDVRSEVDYAAATFDVWVFPFLNTFVSAGKVRGQTLIDLGSIDALGLMENPQSVVAINTDGNVYSAGATLAYAQNNWFGTLTGSYSDAAVEGDFDSSVTTTTYQFRIGKQLKKVDLWTSALYIATDESHAGQIDLDLGTIMFSSIDFATTLQQQQSVNYGVGARYNFSESLSATLELGFGRRENQFFNVAYRF